MLVSQLLDAGHNTSVFSCGEPVLDAWLIDQDLAATELAHLLIHVVHLPDAEVRAMSKDQAVERLNQYWTEGT